MGARVDHSYKRQSIMTGDDFPGDVVATYETKSPCAGGACIPFSGSLSGACALCAGSDCVHAVGAPEPHGRRILDTRSHPAHTTPHDATQYSKSLRGAEMWQHTPNPLACLPLARGRCLLVYAAQVRRGI